MKTGLDSWKRQRLCGGGIDTSVVKPNARTSGDLVGNSRRVHKAARASRVKWAGVGSQLWGANPHPHKHLWVGIQTEKEAGCKPVT